jgi:antitoxin component YwqK of YwqJK toxin-antitoxin module
LTKYGEWENSQKHGASRSFYPSGTPWSEHTYERGIQVGDYRTWHPNAQPFIVGQYSPTGKPTGVWQFFSESGKLIREQPGDSIQP